MSNDLAGVRATFAFQVDAEWVKQPQNTWFLVDRDALKSARQFYAYVTLDRDGTWGWVTLVNYPERERRGKGEATRDDAVASVYRELGVHNGSAD